MEWTADAMSNLCSKACDQGARTVPWKEFQKNLDDGASDGSSDHIQEDLRPQNYFAKTKDFLLHTLNLMVQGNIKICPVEARAGQVTSIPPAR